MIINIFVYMDTYRYCICCICTSSAYGKFLKESSCSTKALDALLTSLCTRDKGITYHRSNIYVMSKSYRFVDANYADNPTSKRSLFCYVMMILDIYLGDLSYYK